MFIYFCDRERQSMNGGGAEREGDTESDRLQALSHQPRAWCRARTHGPQDRDLSWSRTLNRLSHPGAPWGFLLRKDAVHVKCFFCIYWQDHLVLILSSVNVMYHVDWFANIEPALQSRNESHLIMVILFIYCWIRFASTLSRISASRFIRDTGL